MTLVFYQEKKEKKYWTTTTTTKNTEDKHSQQQQQQQQKSKTQGGVEIQSHYPLARVYWECAQAFHCSRVFYYNQNERILMGTIEILSKAFLHKNPSHLVSAFHDVNIRALRIISCCPGDIPLTCWRAPPPRVGIYPPDVNRAFRCPSPCSISQVLSLMAAATVPTPSWRKTKLKRV